MTSRPLAVLMVGLAAIHLSCRGATNVPGLSERDRAALKAVLDKDTQAARSGDMEALTALYAADAIRMAPNQPAITGLEAIRAYHKQFPPMSKFAFTVTELDGRGDVAWYRGNYALTFTPPGATASVSDTGKLIAILRKQPDGSWLTVADIWNSDLPPPR